MLTTPPNFMQEPQIQPIEFSLKHPEKPQHPLSESLGK
jgi:hypothetical protein